MRPRRRSQLSKGAQRPKAWERIQQSVVAVAAASDWQCSTPEGMGADSTRSRTRTVPSCTRSAQRPKAWERIQRAGLRGTVGRSHVLNARRHGSGFNPRRSSRASARPPSAQRPKAWERIQRRSRSFRAARGGIQGAQRPKAWERIQPDPETAHAAWFECSTPEGMGADSTPLFADRSLPAPRGAQRPKAWERIQH